MVFGNISSLDYISISLKGPVTSDCFRMWKWCRTQGKDWNSFAICAVVLILVRNYMCKKGGTPTTNVWLTQDADSISKLCIPSSQILLIPLKLLAVYFHGWLEMDCEDHPGVPVESVMSAHRLFYFTVSLTRSKYDKAKRETASRKCVYEVNPYISF